MLLVVGMLTFFTVLSAAYFVAGYASRNPLVEREPGARLSKAKRSVMEDLYRIWGVSRDTAMSPDAAFTAAVIGAVVSAMAGCLLGGVPIGVALGMLGFMFAPRPASTFVTKAKVKAIKTNMEFVVDILLGCLESGMGIKEAVRETARVAPREVQDELSRVYMAVEYANVPPSEAFAGMARRVPCVETEELRDAVELYMKVGGRESLELIRSVIRNIKEGTNARYQVDQETKGVKMSGLIVGAMPLAYIVAMFFVAPDLIKVLFNHPLGKNVLGGCVVLYIFGAWLMWTIIKGVEEF
ncbi:MAG: hypothetical protein C4542_02110 [Dehalococcoidia bacterium]|nr:MAG: hypothetical protein C4542_02110 [Dehalococcoidia bacterium]